MIASRIFLSVSFCTLYKCINAMYSQTLHPNRENFDQKRIAKTGNSVGPLQQSEFKKMNKFSTVSSYNHKS